MRTRRYLFAALLGLAALQSLPARAQTVADLTKRGTVNIGCILDSPPYGLLDANQQPQGYDIDVANLLGKYMGVKVNIVPLVGANRVPFLLTGKVDLVIAGMGITPERAKQIAFSSPYLPIDNVVFAPKDTKITSVQDMAKLRVGVVRGSAQDSIITGIIGNAAISRFDENPTLVQAMLTGQVDAIALTAILGEPVFAQHPEAHVERKITLLQQNDGIGVRLDAPSLLQWVNTFVFYIRTDGELAAIYQKWFKQPLPAMSGF